MLLGPEIDILVVSEAPAQAWVAEWREGKNLLLWADKAGGGWIHAQHGASQQRALELPTPSSPPRQCWQTWKGHGAGPGMLRGPRAGWGSLLLRGDAG